MALPQADVKPIYPEPPAYFEEALKDAERLLKYAAEMGIPIEDDVRDHILHARVAYSSGWREETVANLLASLGKLAAQLNPVTAASLKACAGRPKVRKYWIVSICLAVFIVPFSVASFVTSAISNTLKTDILEANDLTVKLRAQLGPPPSSPRPAGQTGTEGGATQPAGAGSAAIAETTVITELQQYASDIRAIDSGARQLRVLVIGPGLDPYPAIRTNTTEIHKKFQLPDGLTDFAWAAGDRTRVYQDVRYFGQSLVDDVAVFYGAITACILPVLYALLGTCAYLLRSFERQIAARTYAPSVADSPRFLIAGIGGAVVGLFNNFAIGQGVSIPPLAIAFLVGYAVDVFFAFLEGMVQKFTKSSAASSTPPATEAGKA
jgi:hypothetical protein